MNKKCENFYKKKLIEELSLYYKNSGKRHLSLPKLKEPSPNSRWLRGIGLVSLLDHAEGLTPKISGVPA